MIAKQFGMQIIVYRKDAMGRLGTVAVLDGQAAYGLVGVAKIVEAINQAAKQEG